MEVVLGKLMGSPWVALGYPVGNLWVPRGYPKVSRRKEAHDMPMKCAKKYSYKR